MIVAIIAVIVIVLACDAVLWFSVYRYLRKGKPLWGARTGDWEETDRNLDIIGANVVICFVNVGAALFFTVLRLLLVRA